MLFLSVDISAQNIVLLGDTNNGYIIPRPSVGWQIMGIATQYTIPKFQYYTFRRGNDYPIQTEGTKIYGISALLDDHIGAAADSGNYAFLVKDDQSCMVLDSMRIDTVTPTTYLHIINPQITYQYPMPDTMLPLYEVFFDRGYPMDTSRCIIALGNKNYPTKYEVDNYVGFPSYWRHYPTRPSDSIYNYYNWVRGENLCSSDPFGIFVYCFPIIDSTRRILHEQSLGCGRIGELAAEYVSTRAFLLHWGDNVDHCLYELAYGRADQPLSSYTVVETTDTAYSLSAIDYGITYAFRVRGKCCTEDSMSFWTPWSDTTQFSRPYYTLTLLAINSQWGSLGGGGRYEQNIELTFGAYPAEYCTFEGWDDGDSTNPRTITLESDTTFTAIFAYHQDSTSIVTIDEGGIVIVAPNPTNGTVRVSASVRMLSVELYDQQGRAVVRSKADGTDVNLDLSGLVPGIYVATIITERGVATSKIVKQ